MTTEKEQATNFLTDILGDDETRDLDDAINEVLGDGRGGRVTIPWEMRNGELVDLTPMQHRFVAEFMKDHNAFSAAKRAGYKQASGIHNNPVYKENIRKVLADELRYQFAANRINPTRLLARMAAIADATPEQLKQYVDLGIKVGLKDQINAVEILMKHFNLFADNNKREVTVSLPDLIKESFATKPRQTISGAVNGTPAIIDRSTGEARPVIAHHNVGGDDE